MADTASKQRLFSWQATFLIALSLLLTGGLTACPSGGGSSSETVAGDYITVHFTAPHPAGEVPPPDGGIDTSLVALIDGAESSVDLAAYDLDLESVVAALIRAQEAAVEVRVVVDGESAGQAAVTQLRQARIPLVARPAGGWGIMHNKFVVVDGTWVWTGSWNMTENGAHRNDNNAVLIASRFLAQDYATEFEELFANQFGPTSPADTPYPMIEIEAAGEDLARIEVYFAPEDEAADGILATLAEAESTIRFLAFVFTSQPIAEALIERAAHGVAVTGVLEARSAQNRYSQYERLTGAGIEVLLDANPYIMHHKVFIIDEETVILGSYNFSASAEEENDENLLILHDPRVAATFLTEFERIYGEARNSDG